MRILREALDVSYRVGSQCGAAAGVRTIPVWKGLLLQAHGAVGTQQLLHASRVGGEGHRGSSLVDDGQIQAEFQEQVHGGGHCLDVGPTPSSVDHMGECLQAGQEGVRVTQQLGQPLSQLLAVECSNRNSMCTDAPPIAVHWHPEL